MGKAIRISDILSLFQSLWHTFQIATVNKMQLRSAKANREFFRDEHKPKKAFFQVPKGSLHKKLKWLPRVLEHYWNFMAPSHEAQYALPKQGILDVLSCEKAYTIPTGIIMHTILHPHYPINIKR